MAIIIDGKKIAALVLGEIGERIAMLSHRGIRPGLAVVMAGDDAASSVYIRNKARACQAAGIYSETVRLPGDAETAQVIAVIEELNTRPDIHGILVQLPLPDGCDRNTTLAAVAPHKDVDGFHPYNMGMLYQGTPVVIPCTPAGIMYLFEQTGISLSGKHVVVLGRSGIVGKPTALLCLHRDATVTVCHSRTPDLEMFTRQADIIVSAMGKPYAIRGSMVKPGAVVIDVGTTYVAQDHPASRLFAPGSREYQTLLAKGTVLTGDVCRPEVEPIASYLAPVPGGVGPMTIAMLLRNTVQLAEAAHKAKGGRR